MTPGKVGSRNRLRNINFTAVSKTMIRCFNWTPLGVIFKGKSHRKKPGGSFFEKEQKNEWIQGYHKNMVF